MNVTTTPSRGSDILAFTTTHGDRGFLPDLIPACRRTAGTWFDWLVVLSGAADHQRIVAETFLHDPNQRGIQHLLTWPENRGQHHATAAALQLARERGYKWLLRLDDDITPKTRRWLKKMLERNTELHRAAGVEGEDKLILCPRIVGLKHPIQPIGVLEKCHGFKAEVIPLAGGACRLHPVALLDGYEPPLYAPRGRQDPQALATFLGISPHKNAEPKSMFVRFPDIRIVHRTRQLEALDTPEEAYARRMNQYWPWLGDDNA